MSAERAPAQRTAQRKIALTAGLALLGLALLSPFAYFGVLQSLVVSADAGATVSNLIASDGLFRAGIAAFLVVIVLDVVVAWSLYVLLRPVNRNAALLMAGFRLAFAAVFLAALGNLLDIAHLLDSSSYAGSIPPEFVNAQVMTSIASFDSGWDLSLALFGLHLLVLGALLASRTFLSKLLAVLVVVAGGGYLVDTFGEILVPGYSITVSVVTFVGEALVIVWLLWMGIKGVRPEMNTNESDITQRRTAQPATVSP